MNLTHVLTFLLVLTLAPLNALGQGGPATSSPPATTTQGSGTTITSSQANTTGSINLILNVLTLAALIGTMCVLIRHATLLRKSMMASTYNEIVGQNLHLNEVLLTYAAESDPQLLGPVVNNNGDPKTILLARSLVDHLENVFVQHQLANLPESVWPGWKTYIVEKILGVPALLSEYELMKPTLDSGFVALIENARGKK